MKEYRREYPLISIHIPKAGGTSFSSVLKAWFGDRLYMHYFDPKHGRMPEKMNIKKGLFRRKFKEGICIHGHFNKKRGFGIQDYYPEVDQFISVLRNPLELALSNYYYLKWHGNFLHKKGTASDIVNKYKNVNEYLKDHNSFVLYHFPFELTIQNYKELLEKYFVYIGVLEDIQVSTDNLAKKLGFSKVAIGWENRSERDEKINEVVKEDFARRHKLEFAIYDFALQHYR
jgi:hypothetical protein